MPKLIDLTGEKFGRLLVLERADNVGKLPAWWCACECGEVVKVLGCNLRTGHTKSCGCVRVENTAKRSLTHGMSYDPLFGLWNTMCQRCFNPKNRKYPNYGGRGVVVCEDWRNSFQAFYNYVSQLPHFRERGYSLDRINNDGNYEPGNVRWATYTEQANNRRQRKIKEV